MRPGSVKTITSTANPVIKAARALHMRKARAESGLFLAEGQKLVIDALAAGWLPQMMFALEAAPDDPVQPLAARVRAAGGDVIWTSRGVMEKLAKRDNPQTVIAVFEERYTPLNAIPAGTIVALEAPRDPGNVGTVIRTADALGATGVVLIGTFADPFGTDAVRATMGSLFHVPLARADLGTLSAHASRIGAPLIGTHLEGATDIRGLTPTEPQVLLMGTEQSGLTPDAAARCTDLVKIPMTGEADSLNLAVATAIALYQLRQPFLASAGGHAHA